MKQVIEMIVSGLGIFGLLVVLMALMLFSFYLQLLIARSKDNLQLLLVLGYSPNWLSNKVTRQFLPMYIIIVLAALVAVQIVQFLFYQLVAASKPELPLLIHWSVLVVALVLIVLSAIVNRSIVKRLLYKLD